MQFKTLPLECKSENISLDLLNSINLTMSCSPIMLKAGGDVLETLSSAKAFFVKNLDGSYNKNPDGTYWMLPAKETQIGRARFLTIYGDAEKAHLVTEKVNYWKRLIKTKIDEMMKGYIVPGKEVANMYRLVEQINAEKAGMSLETYREAYRQDISELLDHQSALKELYKNESIVHLLGIFGIKNFSQLTFQNDNPDDMAKVKQLVGKDALDNWGVDGIRHYAALEINNEKPWLLNFKY